MYLSRLPTTPITEAVKDHSMELHNRIRRSTQPLVNIDIDKSVQLRRTLAASSPAKPASATEQAGLTRPDAGPTRCVPDGGGVSSIVFHKFRHYLSRGLYPARSSAQAEARGSRCDDSRRIHETRY